MMKKQCFTCLNNPIYQLIPGTRKSHRVSVIWNDPKSPFAALTLEKLKFLQISNLYFRNKEGQLADAASETLDLYGQLPNAGGETFHEAQQIVCGKNATFVIKSNGDVYSCGEGSNGRLGHGHSDDVGTLQIIAGVQ